MSRFDASPEPGKVRQMFDGISGSYDRMNDLMTAGLHHRWRELAVLLAQVGPGNSALDVCCGTGDLAFALRRAVGSQGRVVGVDVSEAMLDVARDKSGRNQLYVDFLRADVLELPFPDGTAATSASNAADGTATTGASDTGAGAGTWATVPEGARGFDACTVGFGIRNVPDIVHAFSEMRRVCRPGGKVVCLEITQPRIPVFKQFYEMWFDHAVPVLGRIVSRDPSAYDYLPASVRRFPPPEELKVMMEAAGLRNVRYEILAGGIIAVHHALV